MLTVTRKKSPVIFEYYLGNTHIKGVLEEKDLGVIIASNLSRESHIVHIVLKANRMLGLLKRTCPLITYVKVRRTLYLTLVKSQLSYATEVWSPGSVKLRTILERVQRRATRWILRTKIGEVSYKQRLLTLQLLPLTYDREIRDLVFLFKCISGSTDFNIDQFVTFVPHDRSRSLNPALMLKPAYCKTTTFQTSFFNRIVKPWNFICRLATTDKFSSLSIFKNYLRATYFSLLNTTFDIDMPCTWFLYRNCPCHRS